MDEPTAADALDKHLAHRLDQISTQCAGREMHALIELIRAADLHAYFLGYFDTEASTKEFKLTCTRIGQGIGPMLHALLPLIENGEDGIPWEPSTPKSLSWAISVLSEIGNLSMLRRLAHGERYGLVRCEIHSAAHISIHITTTGIEVLDVADRAWLAQRELDNRTDHLEHLTKQIQGWALDRIDKYVGIDRKNFIRYDSDWDLIDLYQKLAKVTMVRWPEADALPDDAKIGPRTFSEWKHLAITANARATLHISFATRLCALNKHQLELQNLLTIFIRQEDLREIWKQQSYITNELELDDILDVFMLTAEHAQEYYDNGDYPLPLNIRFGKYFALLPLFGSINNPYAFLITGLKRKYRKDWDRAVNLREARFQQDIYDLLIPSRYTKGRENVIIRHPTGKTITDIDAAIFDKEGNNLYLFQLKWLDVCGHSLKERQSKLTNLLKANKWVSDVSDWVTGQPQQNVMSHFNLCDHITAKPLNIRLFVLTRYSVRFSGSHKYDRRATWISWAQLYRIAHDNPIEDSPLDIAWQNANNEVEVSHNEAPEVTEHSLPGLRVDVIG